RFKITALIAFQKNKMLLL
uniref:Uncharacterized protein n=1 Tax=Amphimedon queenslandica TaxID=400682 RepID=A0A1X7UZ43_AMPQE